MYQASFAFRCSLVLILGTFFTVPVLAQGGPAWQYRWQKGQVLTYRVEHITSAAETVGGNRAEVSSKLNLVKNWKVSDVDAHGTATMQLTLVSLRQEQTRPSGEKVLFDSSNPEASTPELKEQMGKFVGKTLASLRVDNLGRVVEVIQGDGKSYESDPPFVLVFPGQALWRGQAWQRSYQVALAPPAGTGEKHAATQTFEVTSIADGKATISLKTQFQALPSNLADRLPLLQKQPQGQAIFDLQTGRLVSARLTIDSTIENYQGQGSSYRLQSQFTEEVVAGQ